MNNLIYVDSQGVVLLDGQGADIDLEYDESTDQFVVTADCERWADDYLSFMKQYYPTEKPNLEMIEEARSDCKKISGRYSTLREVNRVMERYCNPGDWYEFSWEYEDGTPVE